MCARSSQNNRMKCNSKCARDPKGKSKCNSKCAWDINETIERNVILNETDEKNRMKFNPQRALYTGGN